MVEHTLCECVWPYIYAYIFGLFWEYAALVSSSLSVFGVVVNGLDIGRWRYNFYFQASFVIVLNEFDYEVVIVETYLENWGFTINCDANK